MCIDNRHLVYVTPHVVLNIVHFMIVHPTPFSQSGGHNFFQFACLIKLPTDFWYQEIKSLRIKTGIGVCK